MLGQATLLDGLRFEVSLIDAFDPLLGDFVDVLSADSLIADLTLPDFVMPTLSGDLALAASLVSFDGPDALRVTVVAGATAVPEPGTLWLLVAGLLGGGWAIVGRRRPVRAVR